MSIRDDTQIISLADIDDYKNVLGNKTLNLKVLVDLGFNVPPFIAIPANITKQIFLDQQVSVTITAEIIKALPAKRYAVRSSALIEDGKTQSLAGQFLTKLNVSSEDLRKNIHEVLDHANTYLNGDLEHFSIIIQEYITPDMAGVTFTRNPTCTREMVIEYGPYTGEKIVSGAVVPEKVSFYWNSLVAELPTMPPGLQNAIELFKTIERTYIWPQDIEWCIANHTMYFLQTRSITTITEKQYKAIQYVDDTFPTSEPYYYEKTEISEIASRPTPITLDLLKRIYATGGPVDSIYSQYGVKYQDTDFLKIIGNELFVDKEKELIGLLPAYSYLANTEYVPKIAKFSKLFLTLKNIFKLRSISTNGYEELFTYIKKAIESEAEDPADTNTFLGRFLNDYAIIFKINLLSGIVLKKTQLLLKKEPVHLSELIYSGAVFLDADTYSIEPPVNLVGNSLDISDETPTSITINAVHESNPRIIAWWEQLPSYKKTLYTKPLQEVVIYNRLREFGRWLTIKHINTLRKIVLLQADTAGFTEPKNVYFSNIDQILSNHINEAECVKNRRTYEDYYSLSLPSVLTSSLVILPNTVTGVSTGTARGVLLDSKALDNSVPTNEKIILYTEILSPELTKYFGRIAGIVSKNGGMLSHLAIVAREHDIPVVVGFSLSNSIQLQDHIQIDGTSGVVKKL